MKEEFPIWRANPKEAKALDVTFAYDWSPPGINRDNKMLTTGLRFNEPLPLKIHNTKALGYVQNFGVAQNAIRGAASSERSRK